MKNIIRSLCFLKSRLLILLTFSLALQPIISIKSMNPAALNSPAITRSLEQIRNLTWPVIMYLAKHCEMVHKTVERLNITFRPDSGIVAPLGPTQRELKKTKIEVNVKIENVFPPANKLLSITQTKTHDKLNVTTISGVVDNSISIDSAEIKLIDFGTLKPVYKPLTYEEMRKFNTLKEMREFDQAQASRMAQVEKDRSESPWHFTVTEAQPKPGYPVYTVEDYDWQEFNLVLSKDKNKALDYLNYVNDFTEILLRSNSIDNAERTIARLQLANMTYFYGPAREAMQNAASCILSECFNKNTGKIDKLGLSKEAPLDIVFFLDKMCHDKKIIELRKLVGENKLTHLVFNKNYLIPKCKILSKEYHSYKLDQVKWVEGFAVFDGYYTIDDTRIEERSFPVYFPDIKECEFNRELINDVNNFNGLITRYDYHAALKFVKETADPVQKYWRETLLNETFTKEGIIRKFVNDPIYKSISKSELLSVQNDKSTNSGGQTKLQCFNYILALRYHDKLTLESKYLKDTIKVSQKINEALYSLLDIVDTNGQLIEKNRFAGLLNCLKIEDKELLNAFSNNGILNIFDNEFANKCRKLDHRKAPTNQDFIDCANQILFFDNYLAKDTDACIRVAQAKNIFFKVFPDKTSINQIALTELKSLIKLLESPPAPLSKFLQEAPENSYANSENYADLVFKLFVIENELKREQEADSLVEQNLQKNKASNKITPNLPIPNNSGNQNNNLDPNDPEHKKKIFEEQQKIKEVEDQFNNCEHFKKENAKIDNKTRDLQDHMTQGHVRNNEPKGLHIDSKKNPNGFKIQDKKIFGEGLEKIIKIEHLGKTKESSVFPSSWDYKKVIEKIIEWAKKNPSGIKSRTNDTGKKIVEVESPCCTRIIEIIADDTTGIVETIYPSTKRLFKLAADNKLNCKKCIK